MRLKQPDLEAFGVYPQSPAKLLLGLLRPTRGRARVLGRPAGDRTALARVGYLPEETRLFPFLTARETVRFFVLSTHYRRPIDYSERRLAEVQTGMDKEEENESRYRRYIHSMKCPVRKAGTSCLSWGRKM